MQLILLATVALTSTLVDGFSNREFDLQNPRHFEFACQKLYPDHGGLPLLKTGSPYQLQTSSQGGEVTVTISGTDFKGFILQASGVSGTFQSDTRVYDVPCGQGGVPWATIRHSNSAPKSNFVATWRADPGQSGTVTFKGSVVQEWTTFYELGPNSVAV